MKAEHGATRGPALLFRTTPNFTEPAPAAPPIPGMGTDAHSAQEALDKVAQEPSFLGKVANMAQPVSRGVFLQDGEASGQGSGKRSRAGEFGNLVVVEVANEAL